MELSEAEVREYIKRLLLARMRILCKNGFYGLLLMNAKFALDETCETAATDGRKIYFSPAFLDDLSDSELDFVLMHEILHIVLDHVSRQDERDGEAFNIACDIVVNSNILKSNDMKKESITLRDYGVSMHEAPDGNEGFRYTAEEVYEMLTKGGRAGGKRVSSKGSFAMGGQPNGNGFDDHSRFGKEGGDFGALRAEWRNHLMEAAEAVRIMDPSNGRGLLPAFAERMLGELTKPKTDWRTLLCNFVEEEVVDYSFTPPDRRFSDSPFFLPDFNETDESVKKILFMIDTSGSISDDMMTEAFSEVKGAIDQFGGKLSGWLGFFDAEVITPLPFESVTELMRIRPQGGGGTDFDVIFEYVFSKMTEELPVSIIILTDGCADFPDERAAGGIPVLWLINNEDVDPPWGKTARIG